MSTHNTFLSRNNKIIIWKPPLISGAIQEINSLIFSFQSYFRHILTQITIVDTKGWL